MKPYIEYKDKWYNIEDLPNEIWLPISGYVGLYEVSSFGRVRSLGNGIYNSKKKILIQANVKGYLHVCLCKNGKPKYYSVHRLVSIAFLPNWCNEEQVNHRDEDKQNNYVGNLEWCSSKYNNNYGTRIKKVSEKTTNGKKSKQVIQFTLSGDFVAEFPSVAEVQRKLGFLRGNISSCCRGKYKQAYGYIWKYK